MAKLTQLELNKLEEKISSLKEQNKELKASNKELNIRLKESDSKMNDGNELDTSKFVGQLMLSTEVLKKVQLDFYRRSDRYVDPVIKANEELLKTLPKPVIEKDELI